MEEKQATPRKKLKPLLFVLLMMLMGMLLGAGLARGLLPSGALRSSAAAFTPWDLLVLPLLWLLVIGVHEAGHLVAGLRKGMRFLLFIIGPFGLVHSSQGIRFRWFFKLGAFSGLAAVLPRSDRPLAAQMQPMALGGPVASLLLAVLSLTLFKVTEGRISTYALLAGLLSALVFVMTAVPFRSGGFMSDGMQWLTYRRGGADVEQRARLMALMGLSFSGTRPRDLDTALLQQVQAAAGGETLSDMSDMSVWLYSYLHALDNGDMQAAQGWSARMASSIDAYVDGFKQGIATELALFAVLHQRDVEEARRWLARSKGGVVDASRRDLAFAAVAMLEQDHVQAKRSLDDAQRRLHQGMDAGIAHLTAEQITTLRDKLTH